MSEGCIVFSNTLSIQISKSQILKTSLVYILQLYSNHVSVTSWTFAWTCVCVCVCVCVGAHVQRVTCVYSSASCSFSSYPQCFAQRSLSWPSATAGPRQEGCRLGIWAHTDHWWCSGTQRNAVSGILLCWMRTMLTDSMFFSYSLTHLLYLIQNILGTTLQLLIDKWLAAYCNVNFIMFYYCNHDNDGPLTLKKYLF